jgi:hypothetical protein
MKDNNKGFIALFSMIIISFVLFIVAINANYSNLFIRFNILDSLSKKTSEALAESCLEIAKLSLALDNDLSINNVIVPVGKDNCDYSITENNPPNYITIISHGNHNNIHTYFKSIAEINNNNILIISLEQLTNYP